VVEQAVAAARPPRVLPSPGSWQDAFAIPLRPFLTGARDGLVAAARGCLSPAHAAPIPIADTFTAALGRQLAQLAVRTMIYELRVAHDQGRLTGTDGRARFNDFIWRLCEPAGLAALLDQYPVLARLLGTASLRAGRAGQELMIRFAADRPAVVGSLLGGVDPGPAVAAEPGLGDRHRQGRSVTVVTFADGRKVVYKPRSLAAHALFGDVAGWLNQRVPQAGLRTARVLLRPGYGWQEFVTAQALPSQAAAGDFYRREGMLLAALHVLCAVDVHCENVVACGDQPMLIDLETLFHPVLPYPHMAGDDPAAAALTASVQRTSLLPCLSAGEHGQADLSGMGGDRASIRPDGVLDWEPPATDRSRLIRRATPVGPARTASPAGTGPVGTTGMSPRNRPCRDGRPAEPADHEAAVLEGFRLGYDAIVADRARFIRLIMSRADIETRVVVRPSRGYARLLDESTAPDLLRDGRDRDRALAVLHEASAAAHPLPHSASLWRRLAPHEVADLWTGDIPLVTARPAARGLWTSAGWYLPGLLGRPALSCALEKIAAMGDVDRRDQEWIISASLATRRETGGHRGAVPAQRPVAAAPPPAVIPTPRQPMAADVAAAGPAPCQR
jgi:type 2 lantibiotic biosynthesis protein LanM